MLRIKDRHDRDMLYGPTNEEVVTDIARSHLRSYKNLPLNLYHIQWKFRDEVRPRFGVMRGREFLMKDAYSFDIDKDSARTSYNKMFVSYLKTFARMGLTAIPMEADTGPIGGDMSHEFIILADTGESGVFFDKKWLDTDMVTEVDYEQDLQPVVDKFTSIYAKTDEKHDPDTLPVAADQLLERRGIEVGHIFYFGTKYSEKMGAAVSNSEGRPTELHMGSYGIGVSRLVGAIIEASHDDDGIIWPETVAPFDVAIVNLKPGDEAADSLCQDLYEAGKKAGRDMLLDDSADSPGAKMKTMNLIGIPWHIIVGPRGLKNGVVELKCRATGASVEISPELAARMVAGEAALSTG